MKALVGIFNQEKALVGAFSVITSLRMDLFQALDAIDRYRVAADLQTVMYRLQGDRKCQQL